MKKNKLNFCHYSKSRVYGHRSLRGKKVSSHFHFFSLHKVAGQNSSSKKDLYMKQPSRFLDINKKINSV
jgi:hypothetical protein